ncbi:uncharacterized protein BJ171DRAFT_159245 [Polychytrium aggregatum]|uniref:uncharacterized protein n=1 Tax=Polychytrium aggregatum TaxID=110093 RepID=UPI0022FF27D9|nr:uncharacterized protein BJ171DRAFT_159245 [Polychytrium aggregatum]KAI9203079.1 hypothetical protein BJ171DRAFT_159245 [Polychytrium aggregatum]
MSVGELKTTFDSFEDPGSSSNMVSTSPASTDPSSLPQQHSRFSKPSSIYSHNATSSADTSIPFPPSAPSINETISKIYQKASGTRTHSRSSSFGASRHGASSVHANSSTPEFAPSLTFMKSNASVGGLTQGIHDHDRPETTSPSPANAMLHRLERKRAAFQHAHIHNREVALTGPRANILRAASPMEVHGFKPISTEWKPPTQYMTSANPSVTSPERAKKERS